ncbi:MAG: hypothetical protein ABI601_09085 [bacterium]
MRTWKLAVLWTPLAVAACGDADVVPTLAPKHLPTAIASPVGSARRSVGVGSLAPPANVPPEYQHYTSISVRADAGFIGGNTAYGQSLVTFGGNNGTATVDLTARNAQGAIVGSNTGHSAASYVFPSTYSLTASTNLLLSTSCGITINALAMGSVLDSFLFPSQSIVSWGKQEGSDNKGAAQPACPVTPPPPACKNPSLRGLSFDCNSPPAGGGDGSTQPPAQSPPPPEPPTYMPPYYSPRPGNDVCIVHGEGLDWEWRECHWVENNDARIPSASARRS